MPNHLPSVRAATLFAALLVPIAPSARAQNHPSLAVPSVRTEAAPGPGELVEVPSLRSEFAKHYALPGGGFRMALLPEGMPHHWWDGSAWRDFDLSWRPVAAGETAGGFQFTAPEHGLRTRMLADSPMGEWVRVELDGMALQWAPLQIGPEFALEPWGGTVGSQPAGAGIEIAYVGGGGRKSVYTLDRNRLKHDVVLPQAPDNGLGGRDFVLSWLVMVEGVDSVRGSDGADLRGGGETSGIHFGVASQARGLFVSPVTIADGAGRTFGDGESGARYRLRAQGGDLFALEIAVPMAWLQSAQRVWPLRIDPTADVFYSGTCMAPYNGIGAVDSGGYASNYTDVNKDSNPVATCTVNNNAHTMAFARFPAPAGNSTITSNGGLIRAGRATFRFSSYGSDSPWDMVLGPQSGASGFFDLCNLQSNTPAGMSVNQAIFNRILSGSYVVGGYSGWNAISSYINSSYMTPDFSASTMGGIGFPMQAVELAWRAWPSGPTCGSGTILPYSSSTPYTKLLVDWDYPTANIWITNLTSDSLRLNWDPVAGATRYTVKVASTAFSGIQTYSNITTTYRNFTGLQPSAIYDFVVVAANDIHTGGDSSVASTFTWPATPAGTSGTAPTATSFQANWQAAAGATSYELQVFNGMVGTTLVFGPQDVGNVTSYVVTGLTQGTTYSYEVRSKNANSGYTSPWSSPRGVGSTLSPPGGVGGIVFSNITGTSCTVAWNPVNGATQYRLEYSTYPNLSGAGGITTTSPSATLTGLSVGTTYYVRVRAENSGALGTWSIPTSFTTVAAPAAPTTTPATNVSTSMFVAQWTSVPNATSYRVDVALDPAFTYPVGPLSDFAVNGTNQLVSPLPPGTTCYYRVRAWNGNAGPSPNSNVTSVTTLSIPTQPPATPTATAATGIAMTSFVANWLPAANATGYRLDVAYDAAFTQFVPGYQNLSVGNVTTFAVTGLTPGAACHYRVRATNAVGTSGNSNHVAVALLQHPAPTLVSLNPAVGMQGGVAFPLVVTGTSLIASTKIVWNGTELDTTWLSSTQLQAVVSAELLANAGQVLVTLVTPAPGGGSSNARTFTIAPAGSPLPANNLRCGSLTSGASQLLRWDLPPDYATATSLRLRRFVDGQRTGTPFVYTLTNAAMQINATVFPEGVYYFDLVVVRNGVESVPTPLVKVCATDNRFGGDVNGDGFVDGRDLMDVLAAQGSEPDHPQSGARWNPAADCNGDGKVDASDLTNVTSNLGNRQ